MARGQIIVETSQLDSAAGRVEDLANTYKTNYNGLFSTVQALQNSWSGTDNTAFTNQIEGFRDDFQRMEQLTLPEAMGALISRCKSTRTTMADLRRANGRNDTKARPRVEEKLFLLDRVWDMYNLMCMQGDMADYDDMVIQATELVRAGGPFGKRYTHVLVDEYQDVSPALVGLLQAIRARTGFRLFCVGDDWQSIYSFSGGDVWQFYGFGEIWKGFGTVSVSRIETTYRCPQTIVDLSGRFVSANPMQQRKEVRGVRDPPFRPAQLLPVNSDRDIPKAIANRLDFIDPGESVFVIGRTRADVYARNIKRVGASSEFDIYVHGRFFTDVTLHIPGMHNVKNALAATAACICLGVRPNAVKYGLAGFNGAGRRFEFKGKYNGADVYDDYAHHPGELKALLDAVEPLGYKRTILVFQPHTYSRTAALFEDFIDQLRRPDVTYLAEIYAARETNAFGISSADLAQHIPGSLFLDSFEEIESSLRATARPGDVILTVGAGNVYRIGEDIVE